MLAHARHVRDRSLARARVRPKIVDNVDMRPDVGYRARAPSREREATGTAGILSRPSCGSPKDQQGKRTAAGRDRSDRPLFPEYEGRKRRGEAAGRSGLD